MKKHLKLILTFAVSVMLCCMIAFSACTQSDSQSSDSTTTSTDDSSTGDSSSSDSSTGDSSSGDSSTGDSSSGDSSSGDSSTGDSSGEEPSVTVTVTGITLSSAELALNTGDSKSISATVSTSDGSDYTGTVTWTSDNQTVATVTGSGTSATIEALSTGTATITAQAEDYKATCTVTVATMTINGLESAGAYSESIYATWDATNVANTTAYYKLSSAQDADNNWTEVDSNLIRMSEDGGRVDVVGLAKGTYDLKVIVNGKTATATNISVSEYDRSGYAHFNTDGYKDGVGAYTDEGTLKDGALVIYLTEENKNDVSEYCYVYSASAGTYTKTDITSYLYCSISANITLYGSDAQVGIGEILNNRRYSGDDRHDVGIAKLCDVYGAVTIRVIGTVEADLSSDGLTATITGLTDYDATTNGGSEGDNGRMARMTNAHDLTIEGIGTDASIKGWGLHFIASDVLNNYQSYGSGAGKSFEVRNITFTEYPEDAIGMEGIQGSKYDETGSVTSGDSSADADLLSPVEYCWIHNNSFLPGYCANPAESDKAEGDGSCDFKRGQYYTLSYNYFEYCHKTNLIGSSDTSLQYNISMHHNYWYNCGSRIPLARRANIHFYNNYVYADATDSKADLSYVHSVRANSYLYAENNYYEGCKNVIRGGSWEGGAEKSYGNTYFECYSTATPVQAATRTTTIANSCAFTYYSIDYSSFDTNSKLFYYDESTQTSDCYLTDAVTARSEAITGAGVNCDDPVTNTALNKVTPSASVSVGSDGLTVDLTQVAKGSSTVSGVEFTNITGVSSGTVKGKGQLVTFKLASEAELTVSCTASTLLLGELVGSDGTVYANKFSDLTIVLQAGTYVIASGEVDKELTITSLSFADTASSSEARVAAATTAIQALSGYTADSVAADIETFESLVNTANSAYSALTASELAEFDSSLVTALNTAVSLLDNAKADVVEAYIAQIGTVTKDSYTAINTARTAYNALTTDQRALVTNYDILTAAETSYAAFAVTNVIDMIDALPDVSTISVSDRTALESAIEAYEAAQEAYNELDEDQQAEVTNKSSLSKLADLEEMYVVYDFIDLLAEMDETDITLSDSANVTALTTYYNALTADQLAVVTTEQTAKYNAIVAAYSELSSQMTVISFTSGTDTYYTNYGNVTLTSANTRTNSSETVTYDGVTYTTSIKMESKTNITVSALTADMTVTLYFYTGCAGNKVTVNGTDYTIASDGTVSATISAGNSVEITKNSTNTYLFLIVLTPAA